jgi:hypothetical protein
VASSPYRAPIVSSSVPLAPFSSPEGPTKLTIWVQSLTCPTVLRGARTR